MIRYHGTPIGGGNQTAARCLQGRHAMVSYAEPSQIHVVAEMCQSFTVDNGAFSAWKSGKQFDVEGFASFIHVWCRHPGLDWYVIPDVIDGSEAENRIMTATWHNLVSAEVWALGVPVWHLHESLEYLDILSRSYRRIALGSSGEYAVIGNAKWWSRITEAMEKVCDDGLPRCRIHGLRMLDNTITSHLPLASADSTNAARNNGETDRWRGPYAPPNSHTRATVLMERIESHATASRWTGSAGVKKNMELFG